MKHQTSWIKSDERCTSPLNRKAEKMLRKNKKKPNKWKNTFLYSYIRDAISYRCHFSPNQSINSMKRQSKTQWELVCWYEKREH